MTTVLVVQASDDLLEMYEEILAIGGHTPRTAKTAAEAVKAVQAERPAVVVLGLSIVGGAEPVLDALRGPPPVSVILASGARGLAERAAALGVPYLRKPFTPDQLLEAITRVTSR